MDAPEFDEAQHHLRRYRHNGLLSRPGLSNGLNIPGVFTGTIYNRENIGKTSEELVAKWNEEFPDDQVVFSAN